MTTATLPKKTSRNGAKPAAPSCEIVQVTPAMAKDWLLLNKSNRPLRDRHILRCQRDMETGNWLFTGEAIKFDIDGRLVDGQHRLTALLRYGKPLPLLVVRNVQDRSQNVMDTGAKRTAADMFALNGKQNTALLAAAGKLAINWEAGIIRTSGSTLTIDPTHSELLAFVEQDNRIEWAATRAQAFSVTMAARPSVIAFSLWLTGGIDAPDANRFHQSLAEMTTDGPGDPRYALLRRLQAMKEERVSQVGQAFYFIKAWNHWRQQEQISKLVGGARGSASKFPEPV